MSPHLLATQLNPHQLVAEVLWQLGQKDEARKYFEESRKLDPDNRSLKRALDKTGVTLPPLPEKPAA